jgi:hypothetical protein
MDFESAIKAINGLLHKERYETPGMRFLIARRSHLDFLHLQMTFGFLARRAKADIKTGFLL